MPERVRKMLARHVACFMRDEHFSILSDFRFPLAVVSRGNYSVRLSPEEAADELFRLKAAVISIGCTAMQWVLEEAPDPLPQRFQAIARFSYHSPDGAELAMRRLKYFISVTETGALQVEMLERLEDSLSRRVRIPPGDTWH